MDGEWLLTLGTLAEMPDVRQDTTTYSAALHEFAWLLKDTSKQARLRAGACRFVALRTQIQSELERQKG